MREKVCASAFTEIIQTTLIKMKTGKILSYFILAGLLVIPNSPVNAKPFQPANDATVIETLPEGSLTYQSRAPNLNLQKVPFEVIEPKVSALLAQAYNWGDPRALGQAESLLEPYQNNQSPQVKLIRANIDQASHRFDLAKQQLTDILKQVPNQPNSVLMLSSINLVQGNFDAARQQCHGLNDISLLILKMACMAQVDSMTGQLGKSANAVAQLLSINNGLTSEQQRWLGLMLADMALRLNDGKLATVAFEQLNQYNSMPVLAAKADWLLAHGQWQSVKNLLKDHTDNDALLLRLLITEQHLKDADFAAHFKLMGERVQIWNERGEVAHQREAAQYALLFQNPKPALKLAQLNWQRQRETADVVVYANAAINNQSTADIQIIQEWIQKTGFEYPLLTQALTQKQSSLKKIQGTAK